MEAVYAAYLDQDYMTLVLGFVGLTGFGLLLAVLVWMLGYLVHRLLRFFRA